jgi:hypothetical protein
LQSSTAWENQVVKIVVPKKVFLFDLFKKKKPRVNVVGDITRILPPAYNHKCFTNLLTRKCSYCLGRNIGEVGPLSLALLLCIIPGEAVGGHPDNNHTVDSIFIVKITTVYMLILYLRQRFSTA